MATPESTKNYFKRLSHKDIPEHAVRTFGATGFRVSSIGFGGYRINYNSLEHFLKQISDEHLAAAIGIVTRGVD